MCLTIEVEETNRRLGLESSSWADSIQIGTPFDF